MPNSKTLRLIERKNLKDRQIFISQPSGVKAPCVGTRLNNGQFVALVSDGVLSGANGRYEVILK